jgi:hypothetical protein
VHDEIVGLSSAQLHKLWYERREAGLNLDRNVPQSGIFERPLMDRLSAWGHAVQRHEQTASHAAELRFSVPDFGRTDASHATSAKAKPVRSFLRHLRELTLGE